MIKSAADNIAPPIASCLGDLLTLTLLALSSTALLHIPSPIPFLLLLSLLGLAGLAIRAALRNSEVKHLVWSGWTPLFGAMIISSGTGMVLEKFVKKYEGFALMAVVISGKYSQPWISPLLTSRLFPCRPPWLRWRRVDISPLNPHACLRVDARTEVVAR